MVVIQPDGLAPLELDEGASATFGRRVRGSLMDLQLSDDRGLSREAGCIRATGDHWVISNTSSGATYVVENPEGGGEFVKVAPGEREVPIGYGFARVVIPTLSGLVSFLVWAPRDITGRARELAGDTTAVFHLDRTKKYFLVLVALCEPRLRDPATAIIPTVPQILKRLADPELTRFAVNHHITYLAVEKLRVRGSGGGKADWQRAALVGTALRFDVVTQADLALLPTR
ncbi:hypothetical protein [Nonomuraea jabiensis]|uniref:hypothetical protein n=1 Tax=Nonomuraea jabiensis TaxID=882448 RepID=UPI0036C7FE6E